MIEYNTTKVMNLNFANVKPFEFTCYYIEKASVYWIKIIVVKQNVAIQKKFKIFLENKG